jgi:LacI family transcriptional regulator
MKAVSIKDIAGQVGVSTTTVSFVLNGKAKEKRISEDLKNKILEVATRLNYRPNQVARGLRTGQTHTLGLIIEDISNPFFASLAKAVEEEADKFGYTVMFCCTENNEQKASSLLHMLKHRQMDGFIITPTPGMESEVRRLGEEGRPVVLIDRYFPELDTSYVTVDNFKGAYDATSRLISCGYSRIGLVTTDSRQVQMKYRYEGYRAALKEHHLLQDDNSLVFKLGFDHTHDKAVKDISSFFTSHKIDAVFFTTNYLGVYGLESLRMNGKKIPEEIGVICFDDNDLFRLGIPAISVISQPIVEIGRQAVASLLAQLKEKNTIPRRIMLEPKLLERESLKMNKVF